MSIGKRMNRRAPIAAVLVGWAMIALLRAGSGRSPDGEQRLAAPGLGCACMRQIAATRRTRTGTDMGRISGQSSEHSLTWEHYIQLNH